jgi:hypothetical protein
MYKAAGLPLIIPVEDRQDKTRQAFTLNFSFLSLASLALRLFPSDPVSSAQHSSAGADKRRKMEGRKKKKGKGKNRKSQRKKPHFQILLLIQE